VKPVQFSEPASEELAAAIEWYEQRRPGLGAELYEAIVERVELIRTHPALGALRGDALPTRQLRVARFPYKIVYRVRELDIYVVAVAHLSRRPNYWKAGR
jgi:plasmid stabilization system protein ParE